MAHVTRAANVRRARVVGVSPAPVAVERTYAGNAASQINRTPRHTRFATAQAVTTEIVTPGSG